MFGQAVRNSLGEELDEAPKKFRNQPVFRVGLFAPPLQSRITSSNDYVLVPFSISTGTRNL